MSFKCPANYIRDKAPTVYNNLLDSAAISADDPNMSEEGIIAINDYVNSSENLGGFLKNPKTFPTSLNPESTTYDNDDLKAIIKGLTRKVAVCSTAYKSTQSFTIQGRLKDTLSGNVFVTIFYIMSYIIIAYLGYSYLSNKMMGGDIPTSIASDHKEFAKMIYYFLIVCIPVAMIALMLTNKANVSFNSSRVLLILSFASIVFIGFVKTVASKHWGYFIFFIVVVGVISGLAGMSMYQKDGEVSEYNSEGVKTDDWTVSMLTIIMIAVVMMIGVQFISKHATASGIFMIVGLLAILFGVTYSKPHYRNKRAMFAFVGIFIPFFVLSAAKWIIYSNAGVAPATAFGVAVYVGLKMAILAGLISLGSYEGLRVRDEIKRATQLETNTSKSPYYPSTKPINALMGVYYGVVALITLVMGVTVFSQMGILNALGSIRELQATIAAAATPQAEKNAAKKTLDEINKGQTWGFTGLNISYITSVVIIMSLILSYNGIFAIWLPFVLISVGLLERGVVSTLSNLFSGNITKELPNWQPVGAYLVEYLIKLLTYTPLSDKDVANSGEKIPDESLMNAIGEFNSTMFDRKKKDK